MGQTINERINLILEKFEISGYELSKKIGVTQQSISNYTRKERTPNLDFVMKLLKSFPDINSEWILMGNGNMFKKSDIALIDNIQKDVFIDDEDEKIIMVPLYNLDARAGMHGSNETDISEGEYIVNYIPFKGAKDEDRCFPIYGDSMNSIYPSGSIVLARKVHHWREYFGYGGIFYIFLNDGRRILKQVFKSQEDPKKFVLCHSFNSAFEDEELPKDMIHSVWKVIKGLTEPGW